MAGPIPALCEPSPLVGRIADNYHGNDNENLEQMACNRFIISDIFYCNIRIQGITRELSHK